MKRKNHMSWETYFMSVAILSSFRSKDPYKQNGACIVNSDKKIIGIGYNGLTKGLDDDDPESWGGKDDDTMQVNPRHAFSIHAERNAVLNANQSELKGSTMYSTQYPCHICAQEIVQVGIKKFIYILKKPHHTQVNEITEKIFKAGGVEEVSFDSLNVKDKIFMDELIDEFDETYNEDIPELEKKKKESN